MNILIIAYYYPPISTGGTMRPLKMAKYLARFGHDVSVLTHSYEKDITEEGNPKIIRFKDISHNKERNNSRKKVQWLSLRLLTEALNKLGIYHSIYSWWKRRVLKNADAVMEQVQPDIIVATYPPVETMEIGLFLSKQYNIPMVADFRDGLMFEPIETKRMRQYKCIRQRYAQIETAAASHAVAITSIADPITDYYRETFQPPIAEVISNAFDPEDLEDVQRLPGDIPFDSSNFNIVFTGRFGLSDKYNRVDFFFDAVRLLVLQKRLLGKTLKINLVGEYRNEEMEELKDLIDQGILVNHGFVKRNVSLAFQKAADLLLIITPPDRKSATSAKIFEYIYAGKPILALTYKTVLEDIIEQTKTGWLVHPHKVEKIATLLENIITDPDFYDSLKPDQKEIEQYSVKTQIKRFERILTDAVSWNR